MALVDQIKNQLSGEVMNRLASLLGLSETQAKSALGAVIPALLSAFSGIASTGGAEKLASAVNAAESSPPGRFAADLAQNPGQAQEQGAGLLESLLGGSTLAGLAGALSKFLGMDSGHLKKLLAMVAPLVLGAISKQMHGKPATAQGVKNLLAEEKTNIAAAMPAGLSLAGIPNLPDLGKMADSAAATVRQTADAAQDTGSRLMKTIVPIAVLALLALLGWQFFRGRPESQPTANVDRTTTTVNRPNLDPTTTIPAATQVSDGLKTVFSQATDTLTEVKDEASAETARPKLEQLNSQLDGLNKLWANVPAQARSAAAQFTRDNLGQLTELIEKVKAIPGAGEKLTPTLDSLMEKLKAFDQA